MTTQALLPQPETRSEERRVVNKLAGAACWAAMYVGVTAGHPMPQPPATSYRQLVEPFTPFHLPTQSRPDVAAIRRISGLSWQQVADAAGVSRRSVHYWVNGGNISKLHRDRLQQLASEVDGLSYLAPETVRAHLMERDSSGQTILGRMAAGREAQARTGPTVVDRMFATGPEPAVEQLGSSGRRRPSKFNPAAS